MVALIIYHVDWVGLCIFELGHVYQVKRLPWLRFIQLLPLYSSHPIFMSHHVTLIHRRVQRVPSHLGVITDTRQTMSPHQLSGASLARGYAHACGMPALLFPRFPLSDPHSCPPTLTCPLLHL